MWVQAGFVIRLPEVLLDQGGMYGPGKPIPLLCPVRCADPSLEWVAIVQAMIMQSLVVVSSFVRLVMV